MEYKKNRHSVYRLQYHLVLVTKYRHKVINKGMNERLKEITYNICKEDHLHIAFESSSKTQLSKLDIIGNHTCGVHLIVY